jgi:hypothetical protein
MAAGFGSSHEPMSPPLAAEFSGLARVAMDRLKDSPYLPLRKLNCRWQDGVLALSGRVPTPYLKQLVLALLRDLGPAVPMIDQIEVVAPGQNHRPTARTSEQG